MLGTLEQALSGMRLIVVVRFVPAAARPLFFVFVFSNSSLNDTLRNVHHSNTEAMALSKRPSEELFQEYRAGDKKAYAAIRGDMEHLVRLVAQRYKGPATIQELVPIGMIYFDLALRKYTEHREKADRTGKKLYKFSTFYAWWARESIRTYLGIARTPLRSIPVRAKNSAQLMRSKPRPQQRGKNGRRKQGSSGKRP